MKNKRGTIFPSKFRYALVPDSQPSQPRARETDFQRDRITESFANVFVKTIFHFYNHFLRKFTKNPKNKTKIFYSLCEERNKSPNYVEKVAQSKSSKENPFFKKMLKNCY